MSCYFFFLSFRAYSFNLQLFSLSFPGLGFWPRPLTPSLIRSLTLFVRSFATFTPSPRGSVVNLVRSSLVTFAQLTRMLIRSVSLTFVRLPRSFGSLAQCVRSFTFVVHSLALLVRSLIPSFFLSLGSLPFAVVLIFITFVLPFKPTRYSLYLIPCGAREARVLRFQHIIWGSTFLTA